jgi:signal transduction histidine kinase
MSKIYSFSKMYHITLAAVLLLAVGVLGTFWLFGEYNNNIKALRLARDDAATERMTEVKTLINDLVASIEYQRNGMEEQLQEELKKHLKTGWNAADALYQASRGHLADEEIKRLIIATLMSMRFFDGRGYFWIHDLNYTLIAHPFRPQSIGDNDYELTDIKGQKIVQSFVRAALAGEQGGTVSYYWNAPDVDEKYHKDKGEKKIARLMLFKPYNWVIGIGEYVAHAEGELQQQTIQRIGAIHPGSKAYVFTHTREGVCLNHVKQTNIGKNRWELVDAGGMKVVQALDRTGRQPGGGFLEYVGSVNPETGEPAKKLSYVQSIEGWGWVVGTGVYLDDINAKMLAYRQELMSSLRSKIATTIIVLLSVLAVAFFIGRQLLKGFLSELNLFVSGRNKEEVGFIDIDSLRIKELRSIAHHANLLLEEKEQTQAALQNAKRMESIGLMAGGVAHDLNNILAGIVGYPEVILAKLPADSELRASVKAIHDSGLRAATVVDDLLTVARGAASVRDVSDLNVLIDEYTNSPECKELRALYPSVEYELQLTAPHSQASCSSGHVKKCLMNLVMNAAEAMADGGTIRVSTENQSLSDKPANEQQCGVEEYLVITVADNGPGISESDIGHIFEPFYTKKEMGRSGTGLGLAVVWNTMADHDGKVTVESHGHGTQFQLFFPVSKDEHGSVANSDAVEIVTGHGERILVVDDEPLLRDIATQMLQSLGYTVDSVDSGEEAVEFLKENQVQLLIIDMLMEPGMNGRETYEEILKLQPQQKAIIASGFSESGDVQEALRLGAGAFVKKPYSMDQLSAIVRKVLVG